MVPYTISLQSVDITGFFFQHVQFPFDKYGISLWFLQLFFLDIEKKSYGHPIDPCKCRVSLGFEFKIDH